MRSLLLSAALLLLASPVSIQAATPPAAGKIKHLVTFGDSYTDPRPYNEGDASWPGYAHAYGNFSIVDVAVTGAVCNQSQVNRGSPILPYQYQQYLSLTNNGKNLDPATTMYTSWIGTNDVGSDGLFGGNQGLAVSVVDTTNCATNAWINTLYASGARQFLFMSMQTLYLTPIYYRQPFMFELVRAGNAIAQANLQALAKKYPAARIGYFDTEALFSSMFYNPQLYLNGTLPLNVLSSAVTDGIPKGPLRDSYLWWDPLHPGEQAHRVLAREIKESVNGRGNYTHWY